MAQKELFLLCLKLPQTHNLGLHFDNRPWVKESEANVCGWKDSEPVDQVGREGWGEEG